MKKTLKIGIGPREGIARYTRDVVAGRRRRSYGVGVAKYKTYLDQLGIRYSTIR